MQSTEFGNPSDKTRNVPSRLCAMASTVGLSPNAAAALVAALSFRKSRRFIGITVLLDWNEDARSRLKLRRDYSGLGTEL
jgi:hypothetical protein